MFKFHYMAMYSDIVNKFWVGSITIDPAVTKIPKVDDEVSHIVNGEELLGRIVNIFQIDEVDEVDYD